MVGRTITYCLFIFVFASCKCLTVIDAITLTKQERKDKRCVCKYQRLGYDCPNLLEPIKRDTIKVVLPPARFDTAVVNRPDTVVVETTKYRSKLVIRHDTIFQDVLCKGDTIYIEPDPCPPRIDPDKIDPEISTWQRFLIVVGGFSLLLILIIFFIRFLFKRVNPF